MLRRSYCSPARLPLLLLAFCNGPDAMSQTVDAFNPDVRDIVWTTALQSDGAILMGGAFTNVGGTYRHHLARLAPDGTLQPSMNIGVNGEVLAIAVQDDGRVLVGGNFLQYKLTNGFVTGSCPFLARFLADGSPDPVFKGKADSLVTSLIVQRDQKILVAGTFGFGLGRLEPDGQADTNFILNAQGQGYVQCVAIQPDGKILVGGAFTRLGGRACTNLGRLNMDGTLDNSFHGEFGGSVNCLAVQPDGKILLNGLPYSSLAGRFLRLNSDGTQDTNFVSQPVKSGPVDPGSLRSIVLQADGSVILGGAFDWIGNYHLSNLLRLRPDGNVDAAWWPGNTGLIYSLAQQADGRTVVAGEFSVLAGQSRKFIARLNNTDAATNELKVSRSDVTWSLGGSSPSFWRVGIAISVDGINWIPLGDAHPVPGGWSLSGLSLSPGLNIRARGYVASGYLNGSSWFAEKTVLIPEWPRIVSNDARFGISSQQFGFNIAGESGQQFVIESSGDLADWIPVATNTLGAQPFYFSQPVLPGPGARFFRLR